jgi:hypothetical protein
MSRRDATHRQNGFEALSALIDPFNGTNNAFSEIIQPIKVG